MTINNKKSMLLLIISIFVFCNINTTFSYSNSNKNTYEGKLYIGGDIMLSRTIGYLNGKHGYNRIFNGKNYNPVKEDCKKNCVLFFNLESPFSYNDNDINRSTFSFRSNPKNVSTLNGLKLNKTNEMMLSLANNHIGNGGLKGIKTTKNILNKNGLKYVGADTNRNKARQIKTVNKNNIKHCFSAYSYDGNTNKYFSYNDISKNNIKKDLKSMKNKNCDINIISFHWGREYKFNPTNWQKNIAHYSINKGADVIIGNHSHIPGNIEKYKGKYIFYSMGNFIFDQNWGNQNRGKNNNRFDTIYDYTSNQRVTPTHIGLNAILKISKNNNNINIKLEKLKTIRSDYGILKRNDKKTGISLLRKLINF